MTIIMFVLATLATLLHVFIFYLESFAWTTKALGVFGGTREEAEHTKELAFNMGFYNLMLAIITAVGLALWGSPASTALIVAGLGSMLAAAVWLLATSPDKLGAAVKQGILPLLALIALAFA